MAWAFENRGKEVDLPPKSPKFHSKTILWQASSLQMQRGGRFNVLLLCLLWNRRLERKGKGWKRRKQRTLTLSSLFVPFPALECVCSLYIVFVQALVLEQAGAPST